jgi:hypothetical protein
MSTSVTTGTDTSDINHLKQGIYAHGPFERRAFLPIIGPEVDGFFLSQSVFGQSKTFSDDTKFVDLEDFNPVTYINSSGSNLYPSIIKNVDIRTPAQSDGTIEALTIRKSIARTSQSTFLTEHSVKGHVQEGNEDVNGRTDAITQFYAPVRAVEYFDRTSLDEAYRAIIISDSPKYYWPMDEFATTTASPLVGAVSLVGGPLHEPDIAQIGLIGNAFSFNGTSAYVSTSGVLTLAGYTRVIVEALVCIPSYDASARTLFELDPGIGTAGTFRFDVDGFDGDLLVGALVYGNVGNNQGASAQFAVNTWFHLAVDFNFAAAGTSETAIYYNGAEQARIVYAADNNITTFADGILKVGANIALTAYANIKMQHLAVYASSGSPELTAARILAHANAANATLEALRVKSESKSPFNDTTTYWTSIIGYETRTVASTEIATASYTGTTASYTVPDNTGYLNFYVWGAGGGTGRWTSFWGGGAGGFVSGTIVNIEPGQVLNLIVGGSGSSVTGTASDLGGLGGFGGGGYGTRGDASGGGGGGYSGIFLGSVLQSNAIVIAGGGAGGTGYAAGGGGGGSTGGDGFVTGEGGSGGLGGSQVAGGADANAYSGEYAGSALLGGHPNGSIDISTSEDGGGGGGGYFGGGGGGGDAKAGGGGSDYVNTTYVTTYSMFQGQHGTASNYAYPSGTALISYYSLTGSTGLGAKFDGVDPDGFGGNGAIVIVASILTPLIPIYDYSNALRLDIETTTKANVHSVSPFNDTSDDSFDMLDVTLTGEEIKDALREMNPDTDNFIPQDNRSSGAGFTYDNNPIGTDSIAYGGLKR